MPTKRKIRSHLSQPEQRPRRGLMRTRDLEAKGTSRPAIRRLVDAGKLERVGRGLYVSAGFQATEHHGLAAAALRVPGGAPASDSPKNAAANMAPREMSRIHEVTPHRLGTHRRPQLSLKRLVRISFQTDLRRKNRMKIVEMTGIEPSASWVRFLRVSSGDGYLQIGNVSRVSETS